MKLQYKIAALILLPVLLLCGIFPGYCEKISLEDIDAMEKQLDDIRLKINEEEKALAAIKNEQSYTESAINYSLSLIDNYTEYCTAIWAIISEYDKEIDEIKVELGKKQEEFDEIYAIYLKHLQHQREDGRISLLELIVKSYSLSDFLSSLERANEVIRYDRALLENINRLKSELENQIARLEAVKQDRQEQIDKWEEMKEAVANRIDELYGYLGELVEDFKDKENEISLWESMEKEADEAIKQLIEDYLKQNPNMPSYAIGETMLWPLDTNWNYISSPYGYRTHPITGEKESFHGAIDIPASKGESIYAAHSGTVVTAVYNWSYGNYVIIDHGILGDKGEHLYTLYAHASSLLVEKGDKVSQGDVIAKVGETGSAKGNHLHFEVRLDSNKVNPLTYVDKP